MQGCVRQIFLRPTTVGRVSIFAGMVGLLTGAASTRSDRSFPGSAGAAAASTVVYVDPKIATASCATYQPSNRLCAGGGAMAFRTIQAAAAATAPGSTVFLRGATYGEALAPAVSGTAAAPITFQPYSGETVTISGSWLDPAIDLSNRSYVIVDGVTVANVTGWLRAENTSHSIVRNCTFRTATAGGSRAGLKFIASDFNQIVGNTIDDGNDNVILIDSDRNLVQGNTISRARHALWTILCGNFNVIRGNRLSNTEQKISQITDCEGSPSDTPVKFNATRSNLVEGNLFAYTPSSGDAAPYAGIQYSAQAGIIRYNWFYDSVGPGIEMAVYSDEARYNTNNRIYNNVFYHTGLGGAELQPGTMFADNTFKNNVFYKSAFIAGDTRWPWYTQTLSAQPVQILSFRLDGFAFVRNDIFGAAANQLNTIAYGDRTLASNPARTLAWWQQNYPRLFSSNLEVDPQFVDEGARDFRLAAGSPLIDAGVFLTATTTAGSGVVMPVQDARYFFDGFQIPGQLGDTIQLQGQTETARIVAIDYAAARLSLDRSLTWSAGQGVSLRYSGRAPDVGGFESGASSRTLPATADTVVAAGPYASSNFGSIQLLAAANNPSYQLQSFIKFDLGGVAGAQVAHATLRIYGALVSGGANAATGVFAVSNTSWSETATTWTTMPALGVQIGSTTVGDATPRWYEIDLTAYVREQLAAGASSITVGLKGVAPSPAVPMFGSRESVVGPQLVIASGS